MFVWDPPEDSVPQPETTAATFSYWTPIEILLKLIKFIAYIVSLTLSRVQHINLTCHGSRVDRMGYFTTVEFKQRKEDYGMPSWITIS